MLNSVDLSRVDLNLLVLFETVFEERHVARAAQRLNLSPSAVSHGLGRLRAMLGDPLFLRNPRGVAPTQRAEALAGRIAEILSRVRDVVQPDRFDAATTARRFSVAAPDAVAAVMLPRLMQRLTDVAPGIDVAARDILPPFADAYGWLDTRAIDLALLPVDDAPARFRSDVLYEENFVIAMRKDHPLSRNLSVKRYCEARHVVASHSGDPRGNVDIALEELGLSRRVAVVAPNFLLGMALVSETDLIMAAPEGLVRAQAKQMGILGVRAPLSLPSFRIRAIAPQTAMEDAGTAWLADQIAAEFSPEGTKRRRRA